jgi:hypothetical protein
MLLKKPNLSKSLLGELNDYYHPDKQACGLVIRKKYFEGQSTPQSDVQKLGTYFEYLATGYVRAGDPTPEPEYVYKGTAKEKLSADYERATQSAELFKKIIKEHNIQITKKGEYMLYEGSSGISDVRANWNGEDCIIDIKYTSLFDDKWSEYGWYTERLPEKDSLLLQPLHYKYLINKLEGITNIPFYFFIFHSKDAEKAKIIKVTIDDDRITYHEQNVVEKMKRYVDMFHNNINLLEARPNYLRCKECAFAPTCDKRVDVPTIEEIYY